MTVMTYPRPAGDSVASHSRYVSGLERLGAAIILQAVADAKILCRYGIITRQGKFKPWPKLRLRPACNMRELRAVDGMSGPNDHVLVAKFFTGGEAQEWLDYLNWNTPPATETWATICQQHGAKR